MLTVYFSFLNATFILFEADVIKFSIYFRVRFQHLDSSVSLVREIEVILL